MHALRHRRNKRNCTYDYQDIWPISKYFNKLLPIHKYRLIGKFAITDFHRLTMPGQIMQFITIFVSDS